MGEWERGCCPPGVGERKAGDCKQNKGSVEGAAARMGSDIHFPHFTRLVAEAATLNAQSRNFRKRQFKSERGSGSPGADAS